jgi:hypothetical protein
VPKLLVAAPLSQLNLFGPLLLDMNRSTIHQSLPRATLILLDQESLLSPHFHLGIATKLNLVFNVYRSCNSCRHVSFTRYSVLSNNSFLSVDEFGKENNRCHQASELLVKEVVTA